MKKTFWLLAIVLLSGCAGLGVEKKMTLVPDQFKLEVDVNPQDNWNSKEVTGGFTWNLK